MHPNPPLRVKSNWNLHVSLTFNVIHFFCLIIILSFRLLVLEIGHFGDRFTVKSVILFAHEKSKWMQMKISYCLYGNVSWIRSSSSVLTKNKQLKIQNNIGLKVNLAYYCIVLEKQKKRKVNVHILHEL